MNYASVLKKAMKLSAKGRRYAYMGGGVAVVGVVVGIAVLIWYFVIRPKTEAPAPPQGDTAPGGTEPPGVAPPPSPVVTPPPPPPTVTPPPPAVTDTPSDPQYPAVEGVRYVRIQRVQAKPTGEQYINVHRILVSTAGKSIPIVAGDVVPPYHISQRWQNLLDPTGANVATAGDAPDSRITVDLGSPQKVDDVVVRNAVVLQRILGCQLQLLDAKGSPLRTWAFADVAPWYHVGVSTKMVLEPYRSGMGPNLVGNGTFDEPVVPADTVSLMAAPKSWGIPVSSNAPNSSMMLINVCRSGNSVWGGVVTRNPQYVALTCRRLEGKGLTSDLIEFGTFMLQKVYNLTAGTSYAILVIARLRPGYARGKLSVHWENAVVLPPTDLSLDQKTYGPIAVTATRMLAGLEIHFTTAPGQEGTAFIEEVVVRIA